MRKKTGVIFLSLALTIMFYGQTFAGIDTARWGTPDDKGLTFTVIATDPVPPLIIVQLSFTGKGKITDISPKPKKRYTYKKGTKLLFKNLAAGSNSITVKTGKPVAENEIQGKITYKDPDTGDMKSVTISW